MSSSLPLGPISSFEGISQRDTNFYDHLQSSETRQKICETVREFWEDEIRDQHSAMGVDCELRQDCHMRS